MNVIEWVRERGLRVETSRPDDEPAFFPDSYVWTRKGVLYVDPDKFHVGDFLHEAGHIAVLPSFARPLASGDVMDAVEPAIANYIAEHPDAFNHPEDPVARACLQCGDAETIAWSWAAAIDAGVEPRLVVDNGFDSYEEQQATRLDLEAGSYFGIHGLRAAGFLHSTRDWPRMVRWLAP